MGQSIRWPHLAAISIACAAVGYQTAVILEALVGVSTTTKWGVPIATISAAVLPVIAEASWREGARFKAFLLVLPVLVLMGYVLPSGMSRLGEAQQARLDTAALGQGERVKAEGDLAKSKALVAEATAWVAGECATGKGKKCTGVTFVLEQRQAHLRELSAKVANLTPPPTPWLPAWHPALLTIGLELAAWSALFFGLGPLTHTTKHIPAVQQAITERDFKQEPLTPSEWAEIIKHLRTVDRALNNGELAKAVGVSDGECSKRVRDAVAAGVLHKQRNGREVAIRLNPEYTFH
jgi:uncharacterized membrane protein